jgi:hypothetical protein
MPGLQNAANILQDEFDRMHQRVKGVTSKQILDELKFQLKNFPGWKQLYVKKVVDKYLKLNFQHIEALTTLLQRQPGAKHEPFKFIDISTLASLLKVFACEEALMAKYTLEYNKALQQIQGFISKEVSFDESFVGGSDDYLPMHPKIQKLLIDLRQMLFKMLRDLGKTDERLSELASVKTFSAVVAFHDEFMEFDANTDIDWKLAANKNGRVLQMIYQRGAPKKSEGDAPVKAKDDISIRTLAGQQTMTTFSSTPLRRWKSHDGLLDVLDSVTSAPVTAC